MTDIEQRLREELKAAASTAQPYMLRELTLPSRRRRGAGAPGWLAPVTAVIAVIAVIVGVQVIFRAARPGPQPAATGTMPQFYVSYRPPGTAVVAHSATGAVISRVVIPGAHIEQITGAPDDRTFALSAFSGSGAGEVTKFYAFHLTADGRPGPLEALPLSVRAGPAGYDVTSIALSPDARSLAVAVVPASLEGTRPTAAHRSRIEIATLGTGAVRTWVAASETNVSDLSWADRGRLGYRSNDLRGFPRSTVVRMNLLDTTRPGTELVTSGTEVTLHTGGAPVDSALFTAGGSTVIAWTGPVSGTSGEILAAYSAQTGHRQRVLYRGPGHGNFVVQGDLLSADRSGRHLLMNVQTVRSSGPMVFGRLDNGRFTKLPGPARELVSLPAAW
jgi:hypothetical protein